MAENLSKHGFGKDFCPLGSTDDVSSLEQDLGSVLDWLQVPLSPCSHRCQDGFVDKILVVTFREGDRGVRGHGETVVETLESEAERENQMHSPCQHNRTSPPCVSD